MNINEAYDICRDYLVNGSEMEFTSRTQEHKYMGKVAHAASMLIDYREVGPGTVKYRALGEQIRHMAPALWDYDINGNYVGLDPYEGLDWAERDHP